MTRPRVRRKSGSVGQSGGIVGDIDGNGPRSGIPLQVESPGLMTGLAGIGMAFCGSRLADRVPCVSMLDPPVTTRSQSIDDASMRLNHGGPDEQPTDEQ